MGCFVDGCTSGYLSQRKKNKREGKRNPSLFSAPKDPNEMAEWRRRIISRKGRQLGEKDVVCSLHFREKDIITHDEVKLPNGEIWKSERSKWSLKPGAVPKIFPNCPSYLSDNKSRRKSLRKRRNVFNSCNTKKDTKRRKVTLTTVDNFESTSSFVSDSDIAPDNYTFNFEALLRNMKQLKLPANWWSSHLPEDKGVMFTKLTEDLSNIEKRINIMPSLEVKTFLYCKQIFLREFNTLTNIQSIDCLLAVMDDIKVCKNVETYPEQTKKCIGYVNRSCKVPDEELESCALCLKFAKASKNLKNQSLLTPQQVQNLKRRNIQLVTKVEELEECVDDLLLKMANNEESHIHN